MFKYILEGLAKELNKYKGDRNDLLVECIQTRLDKSLKVYYDELTQTCESLYSEDELKVIKHLNKE